MRLWAELNYNPPSGSSNTLLEEIFEALFCWDKNISSALPPGYDIRGMEEVSDRCTGDADLSMHVALQIVKSKISASGVVRSLSRSIKAAKSDPMWSTVMEDWDSIYGAASKDDNLMQILRWMSYFRSAISSEVGQLPDTPPDRSLSYVDDLSEALTEEISKIASDNVAIRLSFFLNVIDGSILGTPLPIQNSDPHGPVFILLDQSNSMAFLDQRVKGLSLAVYRTIVSWNRECYVIPFSVSASDRVKWYVGGDPSPFCRSFMGGGTSGFRALSDVVSVISELEISGSTAIMVTDGSFRSTPRIRRELKEKLQNADIKVGFFLVGFSKDTDLSFLGPTINLGNLVNINPSSFTEIAKSIAV